MSDQDQAASVAAEEKKDLGNKAFADKRYLEAVGLYTDAIRLDPANHIYFSNRSACHVALEDWTSASSDAKECIKLNPDFLKAYYRLATAQIELNELDAAHATIRRGLALDTNNSQLQKQLRIVNGKRKDAAKRSSSSSSNIRGPSPPASSGISYARGVDSSVSREIMDLQGQLAAANREYNIVGANIGKCQRQRKLHEVTKAELEKLPSASESKMYRGIGKMFMLSTQADIMDYLDETAREEGKRESDLKQKMEYLEKRMNSQRQNIDELKRGITA